MPDQLRDAAGKALKVGARVRGVYPTGVEIHGEVTAIEDSPKHGPVLTVRGLDGFGHTNHIPASCCRRIYGKVKAQRDEADEAAALEAAIRRRARKKKKPRGG